MADQDGGRIGRCRDCLIILGVIGIVDDDTVAHGEQAVHLWFDQMQVVAKTEELQLTAGVD